MKPLLFFISVNAATQAFGQQDRVKINTTFLKNTLKSYHGIFDNQTICYPFLKELGKVIHDLELKRKKKFKPDFGNLKNSNWSRNREAG